MRATLFTNFANWTAINVLFADIMSPAFAGSDFLRSGYPHLAVWANSMVASFAGSESSGDRPCSLGQSNCDAWTH